ncbi:MAG: ATP-binding cassette domain-containing protein [Planctomycetia bacterium]|nr:ATP-binding cassette domain-containing protein [Planctomycetia bacterium]
MSDNTPAIEASGLTKLYRDYYAIRDVTFSVPRGQIAAFLGPNGAGKSTTMRCLTGFMAPTSGSARICGFDVATQRMQAAQVLGYLPENGPLYLEMTPRGLLEYFGGARGMDRARLGERIGAVVERCGLGSVLDKPIRKLSRGYRQRVGMAQAMLHEPDVLIMDEPTSGLDPNQIGEVRKMIRELAKTKTVLLSTHILQEVEAMADRVIFIHEGRIVFDGPAGDMKKEAPTLEAFFQAKTGVTV